MSLGLLGTVQYFLAQFSTRLDRFFGDRGDARGFVYFCEHWYQAFQGKTNLLSPGIFYPVKGTLAYSDLLLGYALPYSLFRALGFEMFTSVELAVILVGFLNYLSCFVLLKVVMRLGLLPSCAAAMFFAFNSPKFFQIGHLQLQFVLFLPLILICLISFAKQSPKLSQKKAAIYLSLAGLLLILQLMTAFYHAWFFVFWSFLFLLLALSFAKSRQFLFGLLRKYWRAIGFSSAVFLLGFAPFMLLYMPTMKVGSWYAYDYVTQMVPEWWSILSMGDGNYLWGWLSAAITPDPPPATWGELKVGLGLVPSVLWILLTVVALWLLRKYSTPKTSTDSSMVDGTIHPGVARTFLALTILATTLFYLLGMKYGGYSPWYFVYNFFPGAGAIRAVSRYVIVLTLPMAIAFAYAMDFALNRAMKLKRRGTKAAVSFAIVLIAAFGVFEQFGVFKVGGTGFSKSTEKAYLNAMVAKLPKDCEAFYITHGPKGKHNPFEYQYDAMLISIMSGIPTLNASSSQFPRDWSLYLLKDADYESNVKKWITAQNITGKVCRLEVGPQVGAFGPHEPNPIEDPNFFVIQHYRDLMKHEPRKDEIEPWAKKILECKKVDVGCKREDVALELFQATQFLDKGSFILRVYQVGLGRSPRFAEFDSDLDRLGAGPLDLFKQKFADDFAARPEFTQRHQEESDADYRLELWKAVGLKAEDISFAAEENQGKGQILKIIADHKAVSDALSDRVFVTLFYFGYLRRDPEKAGLDQWLKTLGTTRDRKHVMAGFINSSEYRERFGSDF